MQMFLFGLSKYHSSFLYNSRKIKEHSVNNPHGTYSIFFHKTVELSSAKIGFLKYNNSERRSQENISLILVGDGHLTNRD